MSCRVCSAARVAPPSGRPRFAKGKGKGVPATGKGKAAQRPAVDPEDAPKETLAKVPAIKLPPQLR
eukprot:9392855-Alexandrium_andersonii.AAC.1